MISKRIIMKVARTKERYEDIINLLENKKYDEIFEAYGQRIYNLVAPKSYKKKDLKKLVKSGRAEDIYRKYGDFKYRWYLNKMRQIDVYNETGSKFKSGMNRFKNIIKRRIAPVLIALPIATIPLEEMFHKIYIDDNAKIYASEIREYDKELKEYAEKIKKMDLTDIQIFAKVMRDMWDGIDGYAEPDKMITGYDRLILKREGKGVCLNFADHTTAQLNYINPEYNARNVIVYLSDYVNGYTPANIEFKDIRDKRNEEHHDERNFDFTKFTGNHMVTAVDIPNKNVSLVIDTTNRGIGVFINGRIHMFYSEDGKGIRTVENLQVLLRGLMSVLDIDGTIIKSFLQSEESLDELEKEYGTNALNQALKDISEIEKNMKVEEGKGKGEFVAKAEVDEGKALKEATKKAKQTAKDNEIAD